MNNLKLRAWKKVGTPEMFNDVRAIDFDKRMIKIGYPLSRDTTRIDTESLDNVKLMRPTGLKDKNGVEIYEGDIIDKRYHNMHTYDSIGVVEFGKGYDSDVWDHGEWFGWVTDQDTSLADVYEKCTVLGNKYENPELLEDK